MAETMEVKDKSYEKEGRLHSDEEAQYAGPEDVVGAPNKLHRNLKSRHMQMIAIGGSIGAGLFVSSGGALSSGGPGSVLVAFMIVGLLLLFTVQALGELAVMYPVNGAFFNYAVRFIDPAWGFAMGWDYAIGWLTVLPFELTAAGLTIDFWRPDLNVGIWIAVFLTALIIVQIFGVRGYGEVEFVLSTIKIIACIGFIILGIIIDCGGVPTDNRGYIGARYWHDPGAFLNGFPGFCSVFVTAAFAFGGTELVGLAAAEAADPRKTLPRATKQVFWRITFFYVVTLFIVGLIVPANNPLLLNASDSQTEDSPFVLAIKLAGIQGLPSVFNAVITISVLSVANSCTFGSTRTIQALAAQGMAPKFLAYVDSRGRPLACVILQLLFGLIAFVGESGQSATAFDWLLSLSGLSYFFVWGSICLSHIRFRRGWSVQGHSLNELPFQAQFGVIGSYIGFALNVICLVATFYVSLYPVGETPLQLQYFFQEYLAAPLVILLYLIWKVVTKFRGPLFIRARDMDLTTGMREFEFDPNAPIGPAKTWRNLPKRISEGLF
jgi:amino acid transporter